jgi:hypothetical protein
MSSSKPSTNKKLSKSDHKDDFDYLEKKYGKEPKISPEELVRTRWNWH